MKVTRRNLLTSTLFGAGYIGLRALATGLPIAVLAKGARRAFADGSVSCASQSKAKYIILSTSAGGDPINANCPGTYGDANIAHSADPQMAPTNLTINGVATKAAKPWASTTVGGAMPQWALDRTTFWHIQTNTPVHAAEGSVLKLMGASSPTEMLPSLLAQQLAPCLGTVQAQPISIGSAQLSFQGEALPILPPLAIRETLVAPTGPLMNLQQLRDDTLSQIDDIYRSSATTAQSKYLDSLVTSQQEVRNINQNLLNLVAGIKDNSVQSEIDTAIALIQMNISPVMAISIPFGGDNHSDAALAKETSEHVTGVASIAYLMTQLQAKGLQDQVVFMSLNVFGRTLALPAALTGRQHNANHQVSITIGTPFTPGVIGAVAPVGNDYGATAIDSTTGAGGAGGDIAAQDTLASFGKTLLAGVGTDPTKIDTLITSGKSIQGALT